MFNSEGTITIKPHIRFDIEKLSQLISINTSKGKLTRW